VALPRDFCADAPTGPWLLSGNEAIVRGGVEARVQVVSGYPGTPASEIGDTFARIRAELGIDFEYAVNEKVALESAFAAALCGARSLCSFKHLGLNAAADPLSTIPYLGVRGGMVIVAAADPGCQTSPNEQDHRYLAQMLGLPALEPADPAEALQLTRAAFDLSEACQLPVLLRPTARLCHGRAKVVAGARLPTRSPTAFVRDPGGLLPVPQHARAMRERLTQRLALAEAWWDKSGFVRATPGDGRIGVIAAGVPRNAVHLALDHLRQTVPVLELAALHPLPTAALASFAWALDEVLVVEELSPYLEDAVAALAQRLGVRIRVRGKRDGLVPWTGELTTEAVDDALRSVLALAGPALGSASRAPGPAADRPSLVAPARPPVLCAGCPHRASFHAATAVFGAGTVVVNDIGCYTLGALPPHGAGDVLLAMGSSIPLAATLARTTGQRTVAFIGDSTFLHAGMPGLLQAVERADEVVVVVLDNHTTAMTGLQPSAAARTRNLLAIVRALGVDQAAEVDVRDGRALTLALHAARRQSGVSVVIAAGPCARLSAARPAPAPTLDPDRCHTCGMREAGLPCGLAPSPTVQRRAATLRTIAGAIGADQPRTSPCSTACPLGICVPAYVGAIAAGELDRALQAVGARAALPSLCAHLCHRPCEAVCAASQGRAPVAINALKRYLTETGARATVVSPAPMGPSVAIVGAGPAGLACAAELVRRGYRPALYDARERPGGMVAHAVPAARMPRAVLERDIAAVLDLGVRFFGGVRLGREVTLDGLRAQGHAAVVLALGARLSAVPAVHGADLAGVDLALPFLSAVPDVAGQRVLVVGGGDVALDVARESLRRGAATATVVCPEPREDMSAAPDALALGEAEGVVVRAGCAVVRLEGPGAVHRAVVGSVVGLDRGPPLRWTALANETAALADRVVFAIGQRVDTADCGLPQVVVGTDGRLLADTHGRTGLAWLFAAGDAVTGPSTVTQAMASGVRTAWALDVALAGDRPVDPCRAPLPQGQTRHRPSPIAVLPRFGEIDVPTAAEAATEAERCRLCGLCANCTACVDLLGCPAIVGGEGVPSLRGDLCNGCGLCVHACVNGALAVPP